MCSKIWSMCVRKRVINFKQANHSSSWHQSMKKRSSKNIYICYKISQYSYYSVNQLLSVVIFRIVIKSLIFKKIMSKIYIYLGQKCDLGQMNANEITSTQFLISRHLTCIQSSKDWYNWLVTHFKQSSKWQECGWNKLNYNKQGLTNF